MKHKIMAVLNRHKSETISGRVIFDYDFDVLCSDIINLFHEMDSMCNSNKNTIPQKKSDFKTEEDYKNYILIRRKTDKRYMAVNPYSLAILGESDDRNVLCGFGKEVEIWDTKNGNT